MSFYNWIQEKLFDDYEEWHMKSPDYNRNGLAYSSTYAAPGTGCLASCSGR